eukprot:809135_1
MTSFHSLLFLLATFSLVSAEAPYQFIFTKPPSFIKRLQHDAYSNFFNEAVIHDVERTEKNIEDIAFDKERNRTDVRRDVSSDGKSANVQTSSVSFVSGSSK